MLDTPSDFVGINVTIWFWEWFGNTRFAQQRTFRYYQTCEQTSSVTTFGKHLYQIVQKLTAGANISYKPVRAKYLHI